MLNPKTKQRELCYIVKIDKIEPITGSDNCESARVGGWSVMVRKGTFKEGDLAIYFEVDSKVDTTKSEFSFMERYHGKIKTQRYTFGGKNPGFYSQGLLMHPSDFGWTLQTRLLNEVETEVVVDDEGVTHYLNDESRFLTKKLGVIYAVAEDNKRKGKATDKYDVMARRQVKRFSKQPYRWLMKREWGKKILFLFFGKKVDNKKSFPKHFPFIKPTDQERIENMVWVLEDKTPYIITQKCDGSSATYILERTHRLFGPKYEFYVCSRNVRQLDENQDCFHEENYYWEAEHKYHIKDFLQSYLEKRPELEYVCVQGELCHPKIQKNPHGLKELHFFAFHMIDSIRGKYDIRDAKKICDNYGIESVPIVREDYKLPDELEDFKLTADGVYDASVCEGQIERPREGFVYYKTTDPNFSFKNVSRKYLIEH